ncbi:MAG: hypothetical protein RL207_2032 [Bacteroidota bacterium]|jgi:hypothetical protein
MFQYFKAGTYLFISVTLLTGCSKKASDYSHLVSSYKNVHCTTLSSTRASIIERKRGIQKIAKLQNEFKEALKFLKQEEKEKLNDLMTTAILDIQKGKCD